jgi:hypothetical protein
MNEYDIEDAVLRWSYDPVLGPAARTLHNLMVEVNRSSDGWPYWSPPSRASRKLQELLGSVDGPSHGRTREELTAAYKAALIPIKSFRTRMVLNFEIEEVGNAVTS